MHITNTVKPLNSFMKTINVDNIIWGDTSLLEKHILADVNHDFFFPLPDSSDETLSVSVFCISVSYRGHTPKLDQLKTWNFIYLQPINLKILKKSNKWITPLFVILILKDNLNFSISFNKRIVQFVAKSRDSIPADWS